MSEELISAVKLVVGLLAIISTLYGFYKIVTDKAKLEADLRNEIKNLKDDQVDMCKLIEKVNSKFEVAALRMCDISVLESRVNNQDSTLKRLETKMDELLRILIERNNDR